MQWFDSRQPDLWCRDSGQRMTPPCGAQDPCCFPCVGVTRYGAPREGSLMSRRDEFCAPPREVTVRRIGVCVRNFALQLG